ncbi:hypothetical protein [Prevotella disiens]|uniref:Uncharacterized protein n=1 Tax=Prevotella disiens TaxID=28130 RepID=A0A3E4QM51_9BACT|nr:hypothetical protein [Prevotella disiens]RGL05246.1 hypothetical protein DXC89_01980 [Prevotella disiens]
MWFCQKQIKERILYKNFNRIDNEVKQMINKLFTEFKKTAGTEPPFTIMFLQFGNSHVKT